MAMRAVSPARSTVGPPIVSERKADYICAHSQPFKDPHAEC